MAKKHDNQKKDGKSQWHDKAFDLDDPHLPKWIKEAALTADAYPSNKKLDRDDYKTDLEALQIELGKLQADTDSSLGRCSRGATVRAGAAASSASWSTSARCMRASLRYRSPTTASAANGITAQKLEVLAD